MWFLCCLALASAITVGHFIYYGAYRIPARVSEDADTASLLVDIYADTGGPARAIIW